MTPRERRTITIGALVVLPSLLYIWGARPYRAALSDARDQLATERATLARERAAIATARQNPQLQHIADSAMRAMQPRLFEGKDDVMASAELAAYIGDLARGARVWLQDAGTRPATVLAPSSGSLTSSTCSRSREKARPYFRASTAGLHARRQRGVGVRSRPLRLMKP